MIRKFFFVLFPAFLIGCLSDNQINISSQEDYSAQGLQFEISDTLYRGSIIEGKLKLNYVTSQNVVVQIQSVDGTASSVSDEDYHAINQTITIPAGESSASFLIESFTSTLTTGTQSFSLEIVSSIGSTILQRTKEVQILEYNKGPYLPNTAFLAAGDRHTCAVLDDKRMKCWGAQNYTQTGAYSTTGVTLPIEVPVGYGTIYSKGNRTCVDANGKLTCWGANYSGASEYPTTYLASGVADQTTVGFTHTCYTHSGEVFCFGDNTYYQLGAGVFGSNYPTTSPGAVSGITTASSVKAGGYFTCALLDDESVRCWGSNWRGALGDGVLNNNYAALTPTGLDGTISLTEIYVGYNHACALAFGGTAYCWGANDFGQLGRGTMTSEEVTPALVTGLPEPIGNLALGTYHTCAVGWSGKTYCWGGNSKNQLGDGTGIDQSTPQLVQNLPTRTAHGLVAGAEHTCIRTSSDFQVYCWGDASSSQVAVANMALPSTPTDLPLIKGLDIDDIKFSNRQNSFIPFGCLLLDNGTLKCWGNNSYHQLGIGSTTNSFSALQTPVLSDTVSKFSVGLQHACALLDDGSIECWGRNNLNQIADGTASVTVDPAVSPSGFGTNFKDIHSGDNHSCALTNAGAVYCWGDATYGQCGSCSSSNTPQLINTGFTATTSLVLKGNTSCAIDALGNVVCWGSNTEGQYGNGAISSLCRATPATAVNGEKVEKLALGNAHACALMKTGAVKCWGSDSLGQLGNGSTSNERTLIPAAISSLANLVDDIQSGLNHTCVLLKTSGMKCWGDNSAAQIALSYNLGTTIFAKATEPKSPLGMKYGVEEIQLSDENTCIKSKNGTTKCWGLNVGGIASLELLNPPFPTRVYDRFQ